MKARLSSGAIFVSIFFAAVFVIGFAIAEAAEEGAVLTGKAAMGDWRSDAPGIPRKITAQDLPRPRWNALANNGPHVVNRPTDAQPKVPPGFKVELYASGFRDPRLLLTARNDDMLSAGRLTYDERGTLSTWSATAGT